MIDRKHDLPIIQQAEVLRISRGCVYYLPRPVPDAYLAIMRRLDRLHLEFPFAGSRMLRGRWLPRGARSAGSDVEMFDESDSGSDPSIRCTRPHDDGSGIPSLLAENQG